MDSAFAKDILEGLHGKPKSLPSKYFYDEAGDRLFQQIMTLPEYYPTRCETEILDMHKESLRQALQGRPFDLLEFGAGDGSKTLILLQHFLEAGADFRFQPVDISANALEQLTTRLRVLMPALEVIPVQLDYFSALETAMPDSGRFRLALFLGSNIGNYAMPKAVRLLKHIAGQLHSGDLLLTGFDLKKDPAVILAAYDDAAGVTRAFNLNLLQRINRELGANFDLEAFRHWPVYNPITGACESHLVSIREQVVRFPACDEQVAFEAWEAIHMELSMKFDLETIESLAGESGFDMIRHYLDSRRWFADSLWAKR